MDGTLSTVPPQIRLLTDQVVPHTVMIDFEEAMIEALRPYRKVQDLGLT